MADSHHHRKRGSRSGTAFFWSIVPKSGLTALQVVIAPSLNVAPCDVELGQVEQALASPPAVLEVEELDAWGLSTSGTALTAHVESDPQQLETETLSRDQLLTLARRRLAELETGESP